MGIDRRFLSGRVEESMEYSSLVVGGISWRDWWLEQIRRCREGYEVGGYRVSGLYYFYLNFFKIERVGVGGLVERYYPYYSKEDEYIFELLEECFRVGKNLMLITARGFGKSYIASCLLAHSYSFYRGSYNVVGASIEKHCERLFMKVREGLNSLDSAMTHNRIKDSSDMIISGTKYKDGMGVERVKGYQSKIEKVVFGNDSGKIRGGRPRVVVLEEVGSWSGGASLKECYSAMESSLVRGSIRTGICFLIGTGGEMDSGGSRDARDMFYNPDAFNLMSFEYRGGRVSLFIPAYKKFGGYYEVDGISDEAGAKAVLDSRRELKLNASIEEYEREIQEFPYTSEEAFRVRNISPFSILRSRLEELLLGKGYRGLVKEGELEMTGRVLYDGLPEVVFRLERGGRFKILEYPYWYNDSDRIEGCYVRDKELKEGDIVKDLYISGCDSYDQDKAFHSDSKGSIFIFKRYRSVDGSGNLFVAQYTDRPESADSFYEGTLLLNLFYRSRMLVEYTRIGIINYYKTRGYYSLLWESPKLTLPDMRYSKASNRVGYLMSERHKKFAIEKYLSYIRANIDKFYFIDQVEEHLEFNMEENRFDRTIASMLCIIQDNELVDRVIEGGKLDMRLPYWQYDEYGNFVFK